MLTKRLFKKATKFFMLTISLTTTSRLMTNRGLMINSGLLMTNSGLLMTNSGLLMTYSGLLIQISWNALQTPHKLAFLRFSALMTIAPVSTKQKLRPPLLSSFPNNISMVNSRTLSITQTQIMMASFQQKSLLQSLEPRKKTWKKKMTSLRKLLMNLFLVCSTKISITRCKKKRPELLTRLTSLKAMTKNSNTIGPSSTQTIMMNSPLTSLQGSHTSLCELLTNGMLLA